jgi:site-specific recombinase XerD
VLRSYKYKRAVEEIEKENYAGAKEYLNKELEENPKNAYASTLLAMAYFKEQDYSTSLSLINQSIKIIPKKNKDFKAFAYLIAARHTFATTVTLANNVPLQEVSAMLGHASTRMTQHYARVMDRNLKDNMNIVRSKMGL